MADTQVVVDANTLVDALKTLQPKKRMTTDEYNRREAKKNPKPSMDNRTFMQNGIEVFEHQLTGEQIDKVFRLKSGIYCDGEFTVNTSKPGQAHKSVNIEYDMTPAARMTRQARYRNLTEILDAILLDQQTAPKK